jgi:hypothetical protein
MSQIIPFLGALSAYPTVTDELEPAAALLLLSVRSWVVAVREGADPLPSIRARVWDADVDAAAPLVDALMRVASRTGRRRIVFHEPQCPYVDEDERHLLRAATLSQTEGREMAERALRLALLEDLGRIFAAARLWFRRRLPSPETPRSPRLAPRRFVR